MNDPTPHHQKRVRAVGRWGVEWRSDNRLDGRTRHFMWDGVVPLLFRTRREARDHIRKEWGYIGDRPDLRREPHGWKMPHAVRVVISLHHAAIRRAE